MHPTYSRVLSQENSNLLLRCVPQQGSSPVTGAPAPASLTWLGVTQESALRNAERYLLGLPVVGGIGSLLLRYAGVRARTLESDAGRSSVSASTTSSTATQSDGGYSSISHYSFICMQEFVRSPA